MTGPPAMEVRFGKVAKHVAEEATNCLDCTSGFTSRDPIEPGTEYVRWECIVDGEPLAACYHTRHSPFPPVTEEYDTSATIKRCEMTDDGDFDGCDCDECGHDMGGNGADAYVQTTDGDTLCIPCAIRAGITEYTLDPETCLLSIPAHAKYLSESDIDTLPKLVKDGVWNASWFKGCCVGKQMPEYQAADEKWGNLGRSQYTPEQLEQFKMEPVPEGAPVWDEAVDGPFWKWSDTFTRPFSLAAFRAMWADLFPAQPDPEKPCPLTQQGQLDRAPSV